MPNFNDLKAINPVPSKLSQEIAAKIAKEVYGLYLLTTNADEVTAPLERIISEAIAPLERELAELSPSKFSELVPHEVRIAGLIRYEIACRDLERDITLLKTDYDLAKQRASQAEAQLSSLSRAVKELLNASQELLDTMETCHICKGALILQESPVHCEDCSFDCEGHEGDECTPIYVFHRALRAAAERARTLVKP